MPDKINEIKIEGETWLTKSAMMAFLGIKKSLFYERVNSGIILSRQPFDGAAFKVYRLNQTEHD